MHKNIKRSFIVSHLYSFCSISLLRGNEVSEGGLIVATLRGISSSSSSASSSLFVLIQPLLSFRGLPYDY